MASTPGCSINDAFIHHAASNEWLSNIVNSKMAEIMVGTPAAAESGCGCLLADIGDYLLRCFAMLSQLANELANGTHISIYANQGIEYAVERSEFSDLDLLSYLNSKHQSLKQIASHIQFAAQTAQRDWQQSMVPPEASKSLRKRLMPSNASVEVSLPVHAQAENWNRHHSSGEASGVAGPLQNAVYASGAAANEASDSPSSDSTLYNAIHDYMDPVSSTLRGKGKGSFYCPLETRCTKGGVALDGTVIQFQRNSAFKSHLQKHEKAYKCDLPGCKNRKGFARIDQLRRHQETVAHHQ